MSIEKLRKLEELRTHRQFEYLKACGDVDKARRKHRRGGNLLKSKKFKRLLKRVQERGYKLAEINRRIEEEKKKTAEKS